MTTKSEVITGKVVLHKDDLQALKHLIKDGWVMSPGYVIDIIRNIVKQLEKTCPSLKGKST